EIDCRLPFGFNVTSIPLLFVFVLAMLVFLFLFYSTYTLKNGKMFEKIKYFLHLLKFFISLVF
ncbi:MAG: hypothetical protein ACE5HX_17125, partial [bacterium]